jgi:hypothetical protein
LSWLNARSQRPHDDDDDDDDPHRMGLSRGMRRALACCAGALLTSAAAAASSPVVDDGLPAYLYGDGIPVECMKRNMSAPLQSPAVYQQSGPG